MVWKSLAALAQVFVGFLGVLRTLKNSWIIPERFSSALDSTKALEALQCLDPNLDTPTKPQTLKSRNPGTRKCRTPKTPAGSCGALPIALGLVNAGAGTATAVAWHGEEYRFGFGFSSSCG